MIYGSLELANNLPAGFWVIDRLEGFTTLYFIGSHRLRGRIDMLNEIRAVGNLGKAPTLETKLINGENRQVTNLYVFFDRRIRQEDDTYIDKGGFWMNVSFWDKRAEAAFRLLKKGTRVYIMGLLVKNQWLDSNQEEQSDLQVNGEYFFIDPGCIDAVTYRAKRSSPTSSTEEQSTDDSEVNQFETA